ncbi:MAG TPA: ATP-binding protein [Sporichthya sp.]|nr:ATP-binding protein [Sporichthya sp.]
MTTTAAARLELAQDVASVGRARAFVCGLCTEAGLSPDLGDTAALLTSEVVTNALVHGRSNAVVTARADESGLLVEVGDKDPRPPRPQRTKPQAEALGGRGLTLVEHLASEWGTYPTATGKVVWFRLHQSSRGATPD